MRDKTSKVTIQDVAERAGVSTATVSRMINENGFVSAEAKEAIQAVIKATGYNPTRRRRHVNGASTALKNGCATLIWTTSQEMQMSNSGRDLMLGLTEGLRNINASLNVDYIDSSSYIPNSLQNGSIDGVFIHGPAPKASTLKYFKKFPVVWLLQQGSKDYGDRAQPDHRHAGKIAAQHLIDQGCRQLCCITTDSPNSEYSQARADAFLKLSSEQQIPTSVIEHITPPPVEATPTVRKAIAAEMTAAFAKLSPRPDGLFVASDLGPYVHNELTKLGIIPMKDVCLVAGDANICAQFPLSPAPVTIRIFSKNIGRQAVELLLLRIKNPDMPQITSLLKPQLELPNTD
jgi:DNA-binding LacI/PurR family transcriptional regulator